MENSSNHLRVALVAGTLGQGGAEKQLVYIARALLDCGVDARVYTLTRGELHEVALRKAGIEPVHFGQAESPLVRLLKLTTLLREFQPQVAQSMHFYTNLYTALAARLSGAVSLGALRNDTIHEVQANGRWGSALLRLPNALAANNRQAIENAARLGIPRQRLHLLPNAIDLADYDRRAAAPMDIPGGGIRVALVARMVAQKRHDRFISALALARQSEPSLSGWLIGDGPELSALQRQARQIGLPDGALNFLGAREDVPALLARMNMLMLTSDHEGFPNAILEGMAARLPVISTPAGDSADMLRHSQGGYVVGFNDIQEMAGRMLQLAQDARLRARMGADGRRYVEQAYSVERLPANLARLYRAIAERHPRAGLNAALAGSELHG